MRIGHRELAAHQYAILNPLQLERAQWADLSTVALRPKGLQGKADALPRLLALALLDDTQRDALLERADAWDKHNDLPFFALLLKSVAPVGRVATHLTRQLVVRAPDGSDALLRWYDPRVFRHLRWLLTAAQLRTLSGPVAGWCWRDGSEDWRTHEVAVTDTVSTRLRPTPEQWATISRMGVLNRTIAQLGRNAPALPLDDTMFRRIDTHLQHAYDHHGLVDEADARLFAEQAIRYPEIHRHPTMAQRLDHARQGEITYVGACLGLDLNALATPSQHRNLQRKDAVT